MSSSPFIDLRYGAGRLRRFLLFLLIGASVSLQAQPDAGTESPADIPPLAERGILQVGATSDSYPYSYLDKDGQLTGFAVDLLDAVARVSNLKIQRHAKSGFELQKRFREHEFDVLQTFSQTPDREQFAHFSVPFLTLQGAIFIQKRGSPIKTLRDFNGRKFVIVGSLSIAEQFLADRGIQVEKVYASSTAEGVALVESGACAGIYASQLTVLSVIELGGFKNVVLFDQPLPNYDIRHCFAVHRGDAQLLARLNEGLAILHRTGEFDRINHRWFGHLSSPFVARQHVINYAIAALALGLVAALWGLQRQRILRRRIAGQSEELAGQQALLQALYDNIPMAMCVLVTSPAGYRVVSINRQAETYFGLSSGQLTGRLVLEVPAASELIGHLGELLQRELTTQSYLREERLLTTARKRMIFTLVPLTQDAAGQARVCVLAEDITERRNLDEEIAQSRKLRAVGELVGGIAHEFNNLLTPIMLKVDQIEMDWMNDRALLAEVQLIAAAVKRASELTRRLLTFSHKSDRRIEEVQLAPVIESCFALLRLTMDRRIQWKQTVPADLPPIYFSVTDLNQIILNLVINARDTLLEKLGHQPGDWVPVIEVQARFLPSESVNPGEWSSPRPVFSWHKLTIRDNGQGMPPEVRERIFEPFFTTKEVGKGTGLGLATVWHLVTEVGGRIEVESSPGHGSAFHIFLPRLEATEQFAFALPEPAPTHTGPARIFLAEDDLLVADAVTSTLQRAGHAVTHVPDGAAAWALLQGKLGQYDLLIFDVNMPGLDGLEVARRVRLQEGYAGRIMIISGRLGSDDVELLSKSKVDCVLKKPFNTSELLEAAGRCLRTPLPR